MKDKKETRGKIISIREKILVWCPRCHWGGLMEKKDVYWCDKCTAIFVLEEE